MIVQIYCQEIRYHQMNVKIKEPPHDKTNKMAVRPEKTLISLGIHPV